VKIRYKLVKSKDATPKRVPPEQKGPSAAPPTGGEGKAGKIESSAKPTITAASVVTAEQFVELLGQGKFDEAAEYFGEYLKLTTPTAAVKKEWDERVERFLEAHPNTPERGKIMLLLVALWQNGSSPDHNRALVWLRKACAEIREGGRDWFDAQFRLVGAIHWDRPEEAKAIARMLIEKSPDLRDEVKGYYWLQVIARVQGKFDEMESTALKLQNIDLHSSRMPKEMLAMGEVYEVIQDSQHLMMIAWAEMRDVPKAERESKIRAFAEKAHFQRHIDADLKRALEILSHAEPTRASGRFP